MDLILKGLKREQTWNVFFVSLVKSQIKQKSHCIEASSREARIWIVKYGGFQFTVIHSCSHILHSFFLAHLCWCCGSFNITDAHSEEIRAMASTHLDDRAANRPRCLLWSSSYLWTRSLRFLFLCLTKWHIATCSDSMATDSVRQACDSWLVCVWKLNWNQLFTVW